MLYIHNQPLTLPVPLFTPVRLREYVNNLRFTICRPENIEFLFTAKIRVFVFDEIVKTIQFDAIIYHIPAYFIICFKKASPLELKMSVI